MPVAAKFVPTDGIIENRPAYGSSMDGKSTVEGIYTGSDSYATGGDSVVVGDLTEVLRLEVICRSGAPGYALVLSGDSHAPKIKIVGPSGELTAATDASAMSFAVRFIGV